MRRRRLLQSLAALPAIPAVPAAAQYSSPSSEEMPKLAEVTPDGVGAGVRTFFTAEQLGVLKNLAAILVPKYGERPGAVEAGAPEFLDFLIRESDAQRRELYRNGLDRLNSDSQKRYGKGFAKISASEAAPLLEALKQPWTYHAPADPFANFLRHAKEDLLQATVNSRVFAQAMSRRSRSASGSNAYWLPLD